MPTVLSESTGVGGGRTFQTGGVKGVKKGSGRCAAKAQQKRHHGGSNARIRPNCLHADQVPEVSADALPGISRNALMAALTPEYGRIAFALPES